MGDNRSNCSYTMVNYFKSNIILLIVMDKKKKTTKPFWELNLNPITMWEPVRDNYLEVQKKTKKYVKSEE